ncbi:unnamed protein product [Heterobilharzia americana]|nr:unnamed protein product [Heterobilharzia americana]CAH8560699.1 unnamed protein product [Heterobilharzia americana]
MVTPNIYSMKPYNSTLCSQINNSTATEQTELHYGYHNNNSYENLNSNRRAQLGFLLHSPLHNTAVSQSQRTVPICNSTNSQVQSLLNESSSKGTSKVAANDFCRSTNKSSDCIYSADKFSFDNRNEHVKFKQTFPAPNIETLNPNLYTLNTQQQSQNNNCSENCFYTGLSNYPSVGNYFDDNYDEHSKKKRKEEMPIYSSSANNTSNQPLIPLFNSSVWDSTNWKHLAVIAHNSCQQSISNPPIYNHMAGTLKGDNDKNSNNTVKYIEQVAGSLSAPLTRSNISMSDPVFTENNLSSLNSSGYNDPSVFTSQLSSYFAKNSKNSKDCSSISLLPSLLAECSASSTLMTTDATGPLLRTDPSNYDHSILQYNNVPAAVSTVPMTQSYNTSHLNSSFQKFYHDYEKKMYNSYNLENTNNVIFNSDNNNHNNSKFSKNNHNREFIAQKAMNSLFSDHYVTNFSELNKDSNIQEQLENISVLYIKIWQTFFKSNRISMIRIIREETTNFPKFVNVYKNNKRLTSQGVA